MYEVYSFNWIRREDGDRIVQQQINFYELLVFQIRCINSDKTKDLNVYFPNFIHQIMECHKAVSHMLDDDQSPCISEGAVGEEVFI